MTSPANILFILALYKSTQCSLGAPYEYLYHYVPGYNFSSPAEHINELPADSFIRWPRTQLEAKETNSLLEALQFDHEHFGFHDAPKDIQVGLLSGLFSVLYAMAIYVKGLLNNLSDLFMFGILSLFNFSTFDLDPLCLFASHSNGTLLTNICHAHEEDVAAKFLLFYAKHPSIAMPITEQDVSLVIPKKPLALVIHGFTEHPTASYYTKMKNKLLSVGQYDQMIIVDWAKAARWFDYARAMANAEFIGRQVGLLLENLVRKKDIMASELYIVSFSMGCQVAHFASTTLLERTNLKVGRITALDPADVMTEFPGSQVTKNDATFVDVIHTSAGYRRSFPWATFWTQRFGITDPIGHVDFYPNGGGYQARCALWSLMCTHRTSKEYYVASFSQCDFRSTSCESVDVYDYVNYCREPERGHGSRLGFFAVEEKGRGPQALKIPSDSYC